MALGVGDTLPEAKLSQFRADAVEKIDLNALAENRKIVVFGLPGAFTRTCDALHMPSFVRSADAIRNKGVDGIYCVTVNDVFVAKRWAESTGADNAGIEVLADTDSSFTKAMGLEFTVPILGFHDRCQRFAMVLENGVITSMQIEKPGECSISTGDEILAVL